MGDRANIYLKQEDGNGIYIYTHWGGTDLPIRLRDALKMGRERWNDESYLGRIIFQAVLNGDTGTSGFGISTYPGDNEYPLLVVDCQKQRVFVCPFPYSAENEVINSASFEEYVKMNNEEVCKFRGDE